MNSKEITSIVGSLERIATCLEYFMQCQKEDFAEYEELNKGKKEPFAQPQPFGFGGTGHPLMDCPNCGLFRNHGHVCPDENPTFTGEFSELPNEAPHSIKFTPAPHQPNGAECTIKSAEYEAPPEWEVGYRAMSLHHPNLQPQWQGKHGVVTRVDAENREIRVKLDECGTGCIFDMDHVVKSASKQPLPPTEQPNERTTD